MTRKARNHRVKARRIAQVSKQHPQHELLSFKEALALCYEIESLRHVIGIETAWMETYNGSHPEPPSVLNA